ncbi:MAG: hypothetical protein AAB887_00350 [Patescibacteria group bacterium]
MILLFLAGLILRIFLSLQIYSGDVNNHVSWGRDILKFGPAGVYQREFMSRYGTLTPTYPPVPLLLFTLSQGAFNWVSRTAWDTNLKYPLFPSQIVWWLQDQDTQPAFHKIWAIAADIGIAWLVYTVTKKRWLAALVLFNPAFFYNSASWGQIESVPVFFLVAAFLTRRPFLSAVSFTLALLTKQSSIIFIPLYTLFFYRRFGMTQSIKSAVVGLAIFLLAFLPFAAPPLATYWHIIQTGSGSDYVVDHAFNFWALTTGLGKIPDANYRVWGYSLFGACLFFILSRKSISVFPAATLIVMAAFFLLTRMHERYLLPALVFLIFWLARDRRLLPVFIYLSLFHWLNLYHNWWYPRWPALVALLTPIFNIQILTLVALLAFIWLLWRYYARD